MTLPRALALRLTGAIFLGFVIAMSLTWIMHLWMAERDAYKLIDREFEDVRAEIEERVDSCLIRVAMVVRDRLPELPNLEKATLRKLAEEVHVDAINVVDAKGILVHALTDDMIGFDFIKATGQAAEFRSLLQDKSELAQRFMPRTSDGRPFKYVGVWRPEGGFLQVGCELPSLRRLSRSVLTGITHNRHVGGKGTVAIVRPNGQIISDARETGREGSAFTPPGEDVYWKVEEIEGFKVYVMLPKSVAAVERNWLVGSSAFLTILALVSVAVLVGFVISGFVREQMQRQMAAEMEMAKGIQLTALPTVFPPFPDEFAMDVFATMHTARDVGGDFYDFYFVGVDRVAYVIADVSGKGVPAALFMMKAKTVIKSCMTSMANIDDAMTEANARLCENNDANMFVTAWVGVLNLRTGALEYVNCGHNPPYVRRADGSLVALGQVSGLFLGGMDGVQYRTFSLQLARNDTLLLYTDGVTEAVDAAQAMFGEGRLEKVLARGGSPQAICAHVKEAVDAFAGGVPQFDDITILALRYRGEPRREARTFPATLDSLAAISAFVEEQLVSTGCPGDIQAELLIAVDEIGTNIATYSGSAEMEVVFEAAENPAVVRLTFADAGKPWNPLAHLDPDITLSAEERSIGGLGILMVKKLMDDVRYRHDGDRNVLLLRKALPWQEPDGALGQRPLA